MKIMPKRRKPADREVSKKTTKSCERKSESRMTFGGGQNEWKIEGRRLTREDPYMEGRCAPVNMSIVIMRGVGCHIVQ